MTTVQVKFVDFIRLYDMLDDMNPKDRPDEEIIENDERLDIWLVEFAQEKKYEQIHGTRETAKDKPNIMVFHPNDEEED